MDGEKKHKSIIMVVSSPSGGGKTTVVNSLLAAVSGIERSISHTTREVRKNEHDKEDYIFISVEQFKESIEKDEFLEWEENFGNYYGTSEQQVRDALATGQDVILSIDVKGARRVKKKFPESVSVFIMPPSVTVLTERLKERNTEKAEQMKIRLEESEREIAAAIEYDYLIVNEDVEQAAEELKTILGVERKNRRIPTEKGKKNG
ncbi:MAG: guanylate kinase [Candidatus Omnitrophica bacterium]|nr:guanylate kinase [Candidatus Omnitrophota bacterium]MBU1128702.1 guanylate kinase [Candidatus Omnitrophota bacterium]MBU1784817.1 guanylate kinase [Candidatus Omnitrophota bacterium]MBU1850979.1 guanylate kinase [Candidatus Omnitrophota bacterium]